MRDIDISPDGSYFVVVTTGAFRANRLCDSINRFELNAAGPGQAPDVDRLDRRRHDMERERQRDGRLRRWAHALVEQPVPRRRGGARARCHAKGSPRWTPAERAPVHAGTRVTSVASAASHAGHAPTACGSAATPTTPAASSTRRSRSYPTEGGDRTSADRHLCAARTISTTWTTANVGAMNRRSYNVTTFGTTIDGALGIDWTNARGAFIVERQALLRAGTTGSSTSGPSMAPPSVPQTAVNLNGLGRAAARRASTIPGTTTRVPAFTTDIAAMTGMFYDNRPDLLHRLEERIRHPRTNNKLYYRYFNPEERHHRRQPVRGEHGCPRDAQSSGGTSAG